jgi:hypothetical protein
VVSESLKGLVAMRYSVLDIRIHFCVSFFKTLGLKNRIPAKVVGSSSRNYLTLRIGTRECHYKLRQTKI